MTSTSLFLASRALTSRRFVRSTFRPSQQRLTTIHSWSSGPHSASPRTKNHHKNIRQCDDTLPSSPSLPVSIQIRHKSIFVSRHNQSTFSLSSRDILDYCQSHLGNDVVTTARTTSSHVILQECPFCPKPTLDKADNLYKLYIQIGGGAYFCHRCGAKGSWFDWKHHHTSGTVVPTKGGGGEGEGGFTNHHHHHHHHASSSRTSSSGRDNGTTVPPLPMPPSRLQAIYSSDLFAPTKDGKENAVLEYLQRDRGLQALTLRKYGVGKAQYSFLDNATLTWKKADCVTFSWIMSVQDIQVQEQLRGSEFVHPPPQQESLPPPPQQQGTETTVASNENTTDTVATESTSSSSSDLLDDELTDQVFLTRRIKARALENKAWQRLDPPGGAWGFFGYHTIPKGCKEIVLTEGEYDAMAVWQATGRPAISLPNGCRSLPVEALPMLEDFDKVYLWMDNDGPGHEGADLFSKKIGLERCFLVRPTKANTNNATTLPKDANDALLQGLDLEQIIADAKPKPHERILSFDELRDDVLHEIMHPDQYVGVPMTSLPGFTKLIQGLRRGELTVLTGPTGSGKTTFLGQMSLDLAEQDVNVLWGSFEIKNTRLLHKLLQQYSRAPLPKGDAGMADKLEALADRFSQLPLHFLKFHGGSDVDDVLDAMEYAVYVNDCQHIILDNMQFMISRQNAGGSSFDKFDVQDIASTSRVTVFFSL